MDVQERLELLGHYLQTYPDSVIEVSYGAHAPPHVLLETLVNADGLERGNIPNPVLARFVSRLRKTRPDLSVAELLALPVPATAGDQEVYTARMGKWLFEKRLLERGLVSDV